jgi:hypothetical protein
MALEMFGEKVLKFKLAPIYYIRIKHTEINANNSSSFLILLFSLNFVL